VGEERRGCGWHASPPERMRRLPVKEMVEKWVKKIDKVIPFHLKRDPIWGNC